MRSIHLQKEERQETRIQPVIRWAGSKRKLLAGLISSSPKTYKKYVEPFVGSACLFLALTPEKTVLGDLNEDLINAYRQIRASPERVHQCLLSIPSDKSTYLLVRSLSIEELNFFERAVRFLYLNRYCFNGLYRTNRSGQFNVPHAPLRSGSIPSLQQFQAFSQKLQSANIFCGDFEDVVNKTVEKEDFVYLDPPYVTRVEPVFEGYGIGSFSHLDLERLTRTLREIDARGATFLMSYSDVPEATKAFKNWHFSKVSVGRQIAGGAQHRKVAREIFISNRPFELRQLGSTT